MALFGWQGKRGRILMYYFLPAYNGDYAQAAVSAIAYNCEVGSFSASLPLKFFSFTNVTYL